MVVSSLHDAQIESLGFRLLSGVYKPYNKEFYVSFDFGEFADIDELRQHLSNLQIMRPFTGAKINIDKDNQAFVCARGELCFDDYGFAELGSYNGVALFAYNCSKLWYRLWRGGEVFNTQQSFDNFDACYEKVVKLLGKRETEAFRDELSQRVENEGFWCVRHQKKPWVYVERFTATPIKWLLHKNYVDDSGISIPHTTIKEKEEVVDWAVYSTVKHTFRMHFEPPFAYGRLPCVDMLMLKHCYWYVKHYKGSMNLKDSSQLWLYLHRGVGFERRFGLSDRGDYISGIDFTFTDNTRFRIQMPNNSWEQCVVWESHEHGGEETLVGAFKSLNAALNVAYAYCKTILGDYAPDLLPVYIAKNGKHYNLDEVNDLFAEQNLKISMEEQLEKPYIFEICYELPVGVKSLQEDMLTMFHIFDAATNGQYNLTVQADSLSSCLIEMRVGDGFLRQAWIDSAGEATEVVYRYSDADMGGRFGSSYRIYMPRTTETGKHELYVESHQNARPQFIGVYDTFEEAQDRALLRSKHLPGASLRRIWEKIAYDNMYKKNSPLRGIDSWADIEEILLNGTQEQVNSVRCHDCGGDLKLSYSKTNKHVEVLCEMCGHFIRRNGIRYKPSFAR